MAAPTSARVLFRREPADFRKWLSGSDIDANVSLGGSFYSETLEDYYLSPYDADMAASSSSITTSSAARHSRSRSRPAGPALVAR